MTGAFWCFSSHTLKCKIKHTHTISHRNSVLPRVIKRSDIPPRLLQRFLWFGDGGGVTRKTPEYWWNKWTSISRTRNLYQSDNCYQSWRPTDTATIPHSSAVHQVGSGKHSHKINEFLQQWAKICQYFLTLFITVTPIQVVMSILSPQGAFRHPCLFHCA